MFKNYLKTAVRNVLRQKGYTVLNIFGLAIGMAVCTLIALWIQDELGYDKFHANADRIHRVYEEGTRGGRVRLNEATGGAVGPILKAEIPEIQDMVRFWLTVAPLRYEDKVVRAYAGFVDSSFLDFFSFPLARGNAGTALSSPNSIILSEEMASRLFGDADPIGKTLKGNLSATVTGVFADAPGKSHLQFDVLFPLSLAERSGLADLNDWMDHRFSTFVLLDEAASMPAVDRKISNVPQKHDAEISWILHLQPLTDIHLRNLAGGGRIVYVYIFGAIAVLVLVVACINFVNLATARATRRAKEIGLRKTVGASRRQLIVQMLSEAILSTAIALGLAICLVELALPFFNDLSGKELSLDLSVSNILLLVAACIITGLLSGSYPALVLSAFQPVSVVKGGAFAAGSHSGGKLLRRALVVFQFTVSAVLVSGVLTVNRQLDYIRNMDLGIDKEQILCVNASNLGQDYKTIKQELLQHPEVISATATWEPPYSCGWFVTDPGFEGQREGQVVRLGVAWVDFDYIETFGLEILEGRSFSEEFPSDRTDAYIVNEAAVRAMEMDAPIGKGFEYPRPGKIIGVVRDFHFEPLYNEIKPMVLALDNEYESMCIKISSADISGTIDFIEDTWGAFRPGEEFHYRFFDELVDNEYRTEQRLSTIMTCFTALAILVSCLGLVGLSAHSAEQRTKEVGIRRVLGASVHSIIRLMTGELAAPVVIACLLAWPIAYYAMSRWLESFAYRIDLGWWTFILGDSLALLIALVTVGFQATKAARADPVKALKYE